jgi:peptidoglycan hydrolase CwlO-like protein
VFAPDLVKVNNQIGALEKKLKALQEQKRQINKEIKQCRNELTQTQIHRVNMINAELRGKEARK